MSRNNIHVQILKLARLRIASRCDYFVCLAILHAGTTLHAPDAAQRIRDWVTASLEGSHILGIWLRKRGIPASEQTEYAMKEHRVAWINRMIEEWKDVE